MTYDRCTRAQQLKSARYHMMIALGYSKDDIRNDPVYQALISAVYRHSLDR